MQPEAIPFYLSNLVGLGFIELGDTALSNKAKYYDPLNENIVHWQLTSTKPVTETRNFQQL